MLKIVKKKNYYAMESHTFVLYRIRMKIEFYKYQATGNDFIMINNLDGRYDHFDEKHIPQMCDRRFGIGADGVILLKKDAETSFYVDYYNADGSQSFCGNGARCSVVFAKHMGVVRNEVRFNAIDGHHYASFDGSNVRLQMTVNDHVKKEGSDFSLYTGSPHYCRFIEEPVNIVKFGKEIRYSEKFKADGINVNTIHVEPERIEVQTYERGVEDETFSCGTGVTACALIAMQELGLESPVQVKTKGGDLSVEAQMKDGKFTEVFLVGPARFVFSGSIDV